MDMRVDNHKTTSNEPFGVGCFCGSNEVSVIAWSAISGISFSFAGILSVQPITATFLVTFAEAALLFIGCMALFALFNNIGAIDGAVAYDSSKGEDDLDSISNASSSSTGAHLDDYFPNSNSTVNSSTVATLSKPIGTQSSSITQKAKEPAKPIETFPLIQGKWIYDEKGNTREIISKNKSMGIQSMCSRSLEKGEKVTGIDRFFKTTMATYDVIGDGRCGYFAFTTAILLKAIHNEQYRACIDAKLSNLVSQLTELDTVSFFDSINTETIELSQLTKDALEIYQKVDSNTQIDAFLTKEMGEKFDLFLRGLISWSLEPQRQAFWSDIEQEKYRDVFVLDTNVSAAIPVEGSSKNLDSIFSVQIMRKNSMFRDECRLILSSLFEINVGTLSVTEYGQYERAAHSAKGTSCPVSNFNWLGNDEHCESYIVYFQGCRVNNGNGPHTPDPHCLLAVGRQSSNL